MAKVITTELQHAGASAANITLDSSKNVTCENNLTVDGATTLTGAVTLPNDTVTAAKTDLSIVQGDVLYGTGTDAWARLAKGTAAQVLAMNSGATAPEWVDASGGMFSRAWYDGDNTETTITDSSGDTRVGGSSGADLNITFTPPSTDTRYLYLVYLHVRFSGGGQWGWRPQFTSNNGTSWTGIGNHPSMSHEHPNEVFREGFVQMRAFHPNTTNECKFGLWAQVWTNHSGSITLNGSNQNSRMFLFEVADNSNFNGI